MFDGVLGVGGVPAPSAGHCLGDEAVLDLTENLDTEKWALILTGVLGEGVVRARVTKGLSFSSLTQMVLRLERVVSQGRASDMSRQLHVCRVLVPRNIPAETVELLVRFPSTLATMAVCWIK